ncbi:MAG: ATP-binding protein [Caulobacterales bacterium]
MRRIKDYLPQGLYGRALAIIILPVVIMQIGITYVFLDDLWNSTSKRMGAALAGDIAMSIDLYERDPRPANLKYVTELAAKRNQLSMTFLPNETLPTEKTRGRFSLIDKTIKKSLKTQIPPPFWFDARHYPDYVEIRVPVTGGVMRYLTSGKRAYVTAGHVFLLWVVVFTALLTTVSVLFIRNQVRPIVRLAKVAEAFGRGEEAPEDYRPSGAREVRQAAFSVLKMRERIRRHVEQRTQLLASVSHDLRTPLTRLKLELAMLPAGPERDAMRRDTDDMEHMLDEYLAFARGQWVEEIEPVDIGALLQEAAAPLGAKVQTEIEPDLMAQVRAGAMKRCFTNLLQNAAGYADNVRACARLENRFIEVSVDDDGPGIPADLRDEALNAFSRLEVARTQNKKGVGLGLAIARDVARSHGGELSLQSSDMGGLRAVVRIPAAAQ